MLDKPGIPEPASRELRRLLGDRLDTSEATRAAHGGDESHHPRRSPDLVAFPISTAEVSEIVRICNKHGIPIIPYGTGTAVEGGVVATHGGVSIDMGRLQRIVEIAVEDMQATVEAGVTRLQLNERLAADETGLLFPVDPGADASLGGMAATRASGTSSVRYGTMRDRVQGLEVVLADGTVVHTGGRARKSSAGYDLTQLVVGSEGTLGIITELILRLAPEPDSVSAAVCSFEDVAAAVNTSIEVLIAGLPVARMELLDEVAMGATKEYPGLDCAVAPTIFFEFHGSAAAVGELAGTVEAIASRHGGSQFLFAVVAAERERLWQARYDAYHAVRTLRPGSVGFVTDVCVPISRLATCIENTRKELSTTSIPAPLFGHVGDGNFHVVFLIDPQDRNELAEVRAMGDRIVDNALRLGGTCTGEHGIGLGKMDALVTEHGPGIEVMKQIKRALDPKNIMNPGKVLQI